VAGGDEPMQDSDGEKEADDGAGRGEKKALNELLAKKAETSAAHGGADRELLPARCGACDEKVGDVEACDEEKAAGCGKKDVKRSFEIADKRLEERLAIRAYTHKGI
jgi:hypothetical protein